MSTSVLGEGDWLCFQLKHIGDLLHTLPALGFLKSRRPHSRVELVTPPALAELAEAHPWIDEVHVLDRSRADGGLKSLSRKLKGRSYAAAFIFDGQTRSIVAAALLGLGQRLGASGLYSLGRLARLYTVDLDIVDGEYPLQSQALRSQKMAAAALGLAPGPALRPVAPLLSREHRDKASALLSQIEDSGPLIGLGLAGRQYEKSWPLAHFAALARRLRRELSARVFVAGGASDSLLARRLAEASGEKIADFCGRTSLMDFIALAEQSNLFISVDTGTAHLTALTETPLISLYQWTSPALWPPQSPHARLLCYNWTLSRFSLPAEGPWRAAPVLTPALVFESAAAILSGA